MKNVAIIMAGGSGTRLWPLSTKNKPKQFLNITDKNKTMLQLSVDRISEIVDKDDIYIVTLEEYKELVYEQIPYLNKENIILQPFNKNTAPCLALLTQIIKQKYDDANVVVLSSDHDIKNTKLLIDTIKIGINNTNDSIVTIGIVPNRIETGYGYIKLGNAVNSNVIYNVEKFVEKPNFKVAKEYYESGNYLWNSGMFIYKNSYMFSQMEKYIPNIFKSCEKIVESINSDNYNNVLCAEFEKMESISIDYAIMEKTENILVIPGNFGWDDVGSFLAIERLKGLDENNNFVTGNFLLDNSNDNIIMNKNNDILITTTGIDNCIIICNNNNILIASKDSAANIGNLVTKIKDSEYKDRA